MGEGDRAALLEGNGHGIANAGVSIADDLRHQLRAFLQPDDGEMIGCVRGEGFERCLMDGGDGEDMASTG